MHVISHNAMSIEYVNGGKWVYDNMGRNSDEDDESDGGRGIGNKRKK